MKKSYTCPLDVVSLKVAISDPSTEVGVEFPAFEAFDSRRDQSIVFDNFSLSISLLAANIRQLENDNAAGVHRPIAITIVDKVSDQLLVFEKLWVTIPKDDVSKQMRIDIPLCADRIDFNGLFVICLHDIFTDKLLIEKEVVFFDERDQNPIAKDWIVEGASISPHFSEKKFRSYKADESTHFKLCFDLARLNEYHTSDFPEMEIRLFFPDGSVKRDFCTVRFDSFDDCDAGKYRAEICFNAFKKAMGVCYAELLCLEEAINGFVFSIDDNATEGVWTRNELQIMDYYDVDSYTKRYEKLKENIIENNGYRKDDSDGLLFSDSDFDRALDDFISSQLSEESEDSEKTDDDSDNEDVTPEPDSEGVSDSKEEESFMSAISKLTGLKSVKEKLCSYEKLVRFNKMREEAGLATYRAPLHAMFLGSPGTGKTTVARRMGVMLRKAGVLSKGHIVVRERATLVGKVYGSEEEKTLEAIEEAKGGILFIDEAYQLYQPNDPRDPSRMVIETLMTALADESNRDWMLILAGYKDEMLRMFEMNPGLKSRIPESNIYIFDDFSEVELMEIAENYLHNNQYTMTTDAQDAIRSRLSSDYACRDKTFGNARHVINLIQTEILPSMASRVVDQDNIDVESLSLIKLCDIPVSRNRTQSSRPRIGYCA